MKTKQAFWMRYNTKSNQGGAEYVAVIANSLDEAFQKLMNQGIANEDISYRNKQIDVLQ